MKFDGSRLEIKTGKKPVSRPAMKHETDEIPKGVSKNRSTAQEESCSQRSHHEQSRDKQFGAERSSLVRMVRILGSQFGEKYFHHQNSRQSGKGRLAK